MTNPAPASPKDPPPPVAPGPSVSPSKAALAREWIDVIAYGGRTLLGGIVPLGLGTLGGVEFLDPALLPSIHMSPEFAVSLFSGACAYYGLPVLQNRPTSPPAQKEG